MLDAQGDQLKTVTSLTVNTAHDIGDTIEYRIAISHEAVHMLLYENWVDVPQDQSTSPEALSIQKDFNPTFPNDEELCYQVSVYVAGKLGRDSFVIDGYNFMGRNKEFNFDAFNNWARKKVMDSLRPMFGLWRIR